MVSVFIKNQDFDNKNNFLDLFPEELSESDIDAILCLINKNINKENEINSDDVSSNTLYMKLFTKKKMFQFF